MSKQLIVYTDGSCLPNQGFGGCGIFGFTCVELEKAKNFRYPIKANVIFTTKGMATNNEKENIEVLEVFEAILAVKHSKVTNNETELLAVQTVMRKALEIEGLTRVLIKTDSKYIVSSFNEYISNWKKNNWRRSNGETVSHLEIWQDIDTLRTTLTEKEISVELEWVKGHSDSFGNNLVDLFAGIGSNAAKECVNDNSPEVRVILDQVSDYKTYKDSFNDKDIVYNYNHLFFGSKEQDDVNYCFLTSANDISGIGKRDITSLFSVNVGYVPEVINRIKARYRSMVAGYSRMVSIRLPLLTDKTILRLSKYINIEDMMVTKHDGYETYFGMVGGTTPFVYSDNNNLPFIMSSNRLFTRILDVNETLKQGSLLNPIDITDRIIKDGKLAFTNMDKFLEFDKNFIKKNLKQVFRLSLGFDLPSYLSLKSMEADIRKVELILVEDESNFVTSYVKLHTDERVVYSVNIDNKFLKYPTSVF
ncbi:putative ribonuclease HI [Bacillus phage vB_BspM_AgentSmith]|nr:putative ribonuclease HI [Bacillus phage vB_BspM_AgentSmith]